MIFKHALNLGKNLLSHNLKNNLKPALLTFEKQNFLINVKYFASAHNTQNDQIKKAPRGPYMIFSNDKMAELRSAHPDLKVPDLGKMIGKLWREMTDKDKMIYKEKYLMEKERFQETMKKLTDDEKKQMKEEKKEKRLQKHLKNIKALKKKLGKPKPSDTNPYILFAKSKMLERGDANLSQYVQGVSDFWKKMPEEDKMPFIEKARKNSLKYRKELAEWEKEMVSLGHNELISKTKLKTITRKMGPKLIKARTNKAVPKLAKKKLVAKSVSRKRKTKKLASAKSSATSKPSTKTTATKKASKEMKNMEEKEDIENKSNEKPPKKISPTKPKKF